MLTIGSMYKQKAPSYTEENESDLMVSVNFA